MKLVYDNKKPIEKILDFSAIKPLNIVKNIGTNTKPVNKIVEGENLEVMKTLLMELNLKGKVDLVYIDPPFSTNNVFKYNADRTSTVSNSLSDELAYEDKLMGSDFLEFLRERLILLRELMAEHASIYLHIDYKIGHYVKVLMDEIFGIKNFKNDISRIKCNPKNFHRNAFGNVKDLILFYTKSSDFIWNEPKCSFEEYEISRLYRKSDKNGRRYTTVPLHAPGETINGNSGKEWNGLKPPKGRHWRYNIEILNQLEREGMIEWSSTGNPRKITYADDAIKNGKRLQDIWEFKDPQYPTYPTEKNIELLSTIIKTSSNEGNIVLDCFAGSGTTLIAASKLNRSWIGIDKSEIAIKTIITKFSKYEINLFSNGSCYSYMTLKE